MINRIAEEAVNNARFQETLCRPLYDSYCFSNIPSTIKSLFGLQQKRILPLDTIGNSLSSYDRVIALCIDSFGWSHFLRQQSLPAIQRFVHQGICSKITSQFPSTTAPHMTCIHTGVPVGQSGILEWFYYEPHFDAPIAPLLYSYAKDRIRNTLRATGIPGSQIFPTRTLYQELQEHGISSYTFHTKDAATSPFALTVMDGAERIVYTSANQGLKKLTREYNNCKDEKAYFFFYYSEIDTKGHIWGPTGQATQHEINTFFTSLEEHFFKALTPHGKKTCVILFSDHGMTKIDPHKTVFLNRDFPEFESFIQKNKRQEPIIPCGSCRDLFLHIEEDKKKEVFNLLSTHLEGRARVFYTKELIDAGIFGNLDVSNKFQERIPNIIVLAEHDYSIWWHDKGNQEFAYHGYHGGLSREEMECSFLFLPL